MSTVHFVLSDSIFSIIERQFLHEKQLLHSILPNVHIEHVGATAVPGLLTKGDLDINIRTNAIDFLPVLEVLRSRYTVHQLENWTPTFASFTSTNHLLGLQVTVIDGQEDFFVTHRDMLRANEQLRMQCNECKLTCEGMTTDEYRSKKSLLYEQIF